ncbi:hypothetical protein [Cumulibacter manganitolerans]|uniref:hypothetical protein n=1 Tax=Cumulibacter manganitolerans TaxID=1884992 RepID=UPI001294AD23|nr:hypothetical protein [Cumulibacter manganitolerans]
MTTSSLAAPPDGDGAAVITYRYVRLMLAAAVFAIGVAVTLSAVSESRIRGSISAYYYSPAQTVFVGALCAIGLALVALQGGTGTEDNLLNLAGLFAMVVAIVPTPVCPIGPPYGVVNCETTAVPRSFVPEVSNASRTLAGVVLAALVYITIALWRRVRAGERAIIAGLAAVWILFIVGVGAALLRPQWYLVTAHYVAASGLFACITCVAVINADRAGRRDPTTLRMLTPGVYRRSYVVLAAVMTLAVLTAIALFVVVGGGGWLIWIEIVLMVAFVVFWLLQTAENWRTESH